METMFTKTKRIATIVLFGTLLSTELLKAEEHESQSVDVTLGVDLVSNYIWRGQDLGGVSVQPTLGVSYRGFSLSAWSSIGFDQIDPKEIDLALSYTIGGFTVGVTDYYVTGGPSYFHYKAHRTGHVFEGNLGYDFGFMALSWNTNFAGSDYYSDDDSKRSYSSYMEVSVPFKLGGIDWSAEVGATPYKGMYASRFAVVNVGLGAAKTLPVTDRFSLPLFAKLIANPHTESLFFVFGLSF